MSAMASQITRLTIVYSTVYSDADARKHQNSAWLAFVRGIYRWPVNSSNKWPVTRKVFPFDDVIMNWSHLPIELLFWHYIWYGYINIHSHINFSYSKMTILWYWSRNCLMCETESIHVMISPLIKHINVVKSKFSVFSGTRWFSYLVLFMQHNGIYSNGIMGDCPPQITVTSGPVITKAHMWSD